MEDRPDSVGVHPPDMSPDSIATAVFTAALMAKGYFQPDTTAHEMRGRLIRELQELGFRIDPETAGNNGPDSFAIQGQVRVRVMDNGQDKAACLDELRAGLMEHKQPLGILIDFKSSLVVNGITRVSLRDDHEKEEAKDAGK